MYELYEYQGSILSNLDNQFKPINLYIFNHLLKLDRSN